MADKDKDEPTSAAARAETDRIAEAANRPQDVPDRAKGEVAAERAELRRQEDVREAVDKAHADELPKLGGPNENPGLG